MRLNAFDLPPTGNDIIDELRVVAATAVTIERPEAKIAYIQEHAAAVPTSELTDGQFVVMGRKVMLKPLYPTKSQPLYESAMFTARYIMWNLLIPKGQDKPLMTIDMSETEMVGTDPEDRDLIAQLIAQIPVLGIDMFVETPDSDEAV